MKKAFPASAVIKKWRQAMTEDGRQKVYYLVAEWVNASRARLDNRKVPAVDLFIYTTANARGDLYTGTSVFRPMVSYPMIFEALDAAAGVLLSAFERFSPETANLAAIIRDIVNEPRKQ